MGRPPTIDRDRVLDLAEALLLKGGTGALTIDAVAKAAGISKGGVQSRFGTKNDLIGAMIERWSREYEEAMAAAVGVAPTPVEMVRGHVATAMGQAVEGDARAAGMMAAMIEAKDHLLEVCDWYRNKFGGLDLQSEEGRRARLALFATEGAFMLRAFGFMRFEEAEWRSLEADLKALLDGAL